MKVTIQGPNLRDQSRGQFHVHSMTCADNRRYGPDKQYGGEEGAWSIEVKSKMDVSQDVYCDVLSDQGLTPEDPEGRAILRSWLSDFWFAPCCADLPEGD